MMRLLPRLAKVAANWPRKGDVPAHHRRLAVRVLVGRVFLAWIVKSGADVLTSAGTWEPTHEAHLATAGHVCGLRDTAEMDHPEWRESLADRGAVGQVSANIAAVKAAIDAVNVVRQSVATDDAALSALRDGLRRQVAFVEATREKLRLAGKYPTSEEG